MLLFYDNIFLNSITNFKLFMLGYKTLKNIIFEKKKTNKIFEDIETEIQQIKPLIIYDLDLSILKPNIHIRPNIKIYPINSGFYIQGKANFSSEIPANKSRGRSNSVEIGYLTWNAYQLIKHHYNLNQSLTPYIVIIPTGITHLDKDYTFKGLLKIKENELEFILGLYDNEKLMGIHKGLGTK
jgi:hypothetical protein